MVNIKLKKNYLLIDLHLQSLIHVFKRKFKILILSIPISFLIRPAFSVDVIKKHEHVTIVFTYQRAFWEQKNNQHRKSKV